MTNKYGLALDSGEFVPADELNTTQPEALRLAGFLDKLDVRTEDRIQNCVSAAAELRRLHAYAAELESQVIADCMAGGAGGASPLMGAAVDAGWVSVDERLPEPDWPVLAHNGKWTGVAVWMSGDYLEPLERWQDEHREFIEMMGPAITHWMPLPPAPSSDKGVAHG